MNTHKVAICAYKGLSMLEFGAAVEIFSSYGKHFQPWYQAQIVSVDENYLPIAESTGLSADTDLGVLSQVNTVVIPGWTSLQREADNELINALQQAHANGARLVSFCSGAFILAQTGLLNGRSATTHWRYADEFNQRFPHVELDVNSLYVHEDNLHTSAGSAACIDLSLELIRQDFGIETANTVAKRLVVPGHRAGGQQQFIQLPVPKPRSELGQVLDWALENLDKKITTDELAERACLTRRTFDRRFRQNYGMSVKQWLLNARVEHAKYLLETTETPIETIASLSGFSTSLSLRNHFDNFVGVSPGKYRKTLGASA